MRRLTPPLLLLPIAALAAAQVANYRSPKGNLTLQYRSFVASALSGGAARLEVAGNVVAADASQGLRMTAARATVVTTAKGKVQSVKSLNGTGGVRVTKTLKGAGGTRVTTIDAKTADYAVSATAGNLKLNGPVKIVDVNAAQRKSLIATGTSGSAVLDPDAKGEKSPLRTATLVGNVRVEIRQAAAAGQSAGTIVGTGDRLVVDQASATPTLTLIGNVKVNGKGNSALGMLAGVSKLVLRLNASGEVTQVSGA